MKHIIHTNILSLRDLSGFLVTKRKCSLPTAQDLQVFLSVHQAASVRKGRAVSSVVQTCRNVVVWLLSTLGSVRGWSGLGLCCVVATWGEVRYYVNLCSSLVTLQHLVTPPHTAQKNNKCNLGLVPRAQFQISNNCYSSLYLVFLNKEWKSQVINLFLCSLFAPSKGYQWVLTNDQIAKIKNLLFSDFSCA